MPRPLLVLLAASVALASPLARASAGRPAIGRAGAEPPGTISLRARQGHGPWRTSLSLKLFRTRLVPFEVCALWNHPAAVPWGPGCTADAGERLPDRTVLRLEQSPVRKALVRADSPGWGLLALSDHPAIEAVLSNTVTGNRFGALTYRATLRSPAGEILVTSNLLKLVWRH